MRIANVVSKIIKRPVDKLTVMTNRQCVNVATDIGKELVDISKSGKTLSNDVIIETLHKHLPCINPPRIASCENDVIEISKECSLNPFKMAEGYRSMLDSGSIAWFSPGMKTICLPAQNEIAREPEVIAHELEHFFNGVYSISRMKDKLKFKFLNLYYMLLPNIQRARKLPKPYEIQGTLYKKFGVGPYQIEQIEGFPSNKTGVRQALASDMFDGMKTEKRFDSYIRAIQRHYLHPKFGEPMFLRFLKSSTLDEARAYTVTDNVLKYKNNFNGLTKHKIRAVLLERMGKVTDNEIRLARKYRHGLLQIKNLKSPSLPSDIYNV